MAKIIAIVNHKGGVGKTTTTVNLGAALALQGKRVLLVDMDSQQNLTTSLMREEDVTESIYDSLMKGSALPVVRIAERLDLCPSELALAAAELHLQARIGRERLLKKLLDVVKDSYDFIMIDCPPSLGLFTLNALVAATDVFLPLTGETLPLRGILMLEETLNDVIQNANSDLRISGVVIQRFNNRKLNNEVIEAIRTKFGATVFNTKIRECIALAEAPAAHCSIFDYDSKSNGARDYMDLASEVIGRYPGSKVNKFVSNKVNLFHSNNVTNENMAKRKFSLMEEVKKPSPTQETEVSDASAVPDAASSPAGDSREIRATFIVDSGIIRKLKLIAAIENRKHKDVVGSALTEYVGRWESDHPSVDLMAIDGMVNK